MLQKIL